MGNFSKFANDHHYASGIIFITVGVVGSIASVVGELPNVLAALWVPNILYTINGKLPTNLPGYNGQAPTPFKGTGI